MEIRVLARQGKSLREIARMMGISRNTVRRHLRSGGVPRYKARTPRPTKLDPFMDYLRERIREAKPTFDVKRVGRARGAPDEFKGRQQTPG